MAFDAENMGKVSNRTRFAFVLSSVAFVAVLAVSPVKDWRLEWKHYRRGYARFAQTRPDTKRLMADYRSDIDQIWIPDMNVVDRCTTCHLGITQPSLAEASVPQPYRAHPAIPHPVKEWGCVVCHRGQGMATEVAEAHETTLAWEEPTLPTRYIQASCGVCHRASARETPQLNRGRQLLVEFNCVGCHRLQDVDRPVMLGPDLTNIGTKVSRAWLYKWLKEPRTIVDSSGNTTVNGYETEEEPRMPQFRLSEPELKGLTAYLTSLRTKPLAPYKFDLRVVAALEKMPDPAKRDQGEVRFRQMFCTTCHSLAVTRAGETKLIGGDIGPELTKVGSKVNPDWLAAWLRDPQSYLAHAEMPRYGWSDEDLYLVTHYITAKLVDPDLLSDVPQLGAPTAEEVELGRRLFLEKGCAGCHAIEGVPSQKDFGPDLSTIGGKNVSQLEFGPSKIPRTLIAYIQTKLTDPLSVNPAARMPQYHLNAADLDALTIALLAMTGTPSASGLERLIVHRKEVAFHPAGRFGEVYERYKCYACHQFNGYGSTLAPDISFEGSRARRGWIIQFLKNPQTLRPTLIFRMPQFNMTDEEASVLADYLGMVFQSPAVKPVDEKELTPELAARGKQLYEVKYQCQSCHTIGSSGGYVGPNLNNVGNWMTAGWIEAWLKNPQALVPGAIEPKRAFAGDEIKALTAYLLTLRQATTTGKRGSGEKGKRASLFPFLSFLLFPFRKQKGEKRKRYRLSLQRFHIFPFSLLPFSPLLWALLISGCLTLAACHKKHAAMTSDPLLRAYDTEPDWNDPQHAIPLNYRQSQGKGVFYKNCVWCHADATPAGPSNRSNLTPNPPLFNDGTTLNGVSDEFMQNIITLGGSALGKSAMMPPWGQTLTQNEVRAVIAYARAIAQPPYKPPARPGPQYSVK